MRQRLKESVEQQQKYEENRMQLIAGISHDLGTPLTTIKGYASGILDGIADTDEKRCAMSGSFMTPRRAWTPSFPSFRCSQSSALTKCRFILKDKGEGLL